MNKTKKPPTEVFFRGASPRASDPIGGSTVSLEGGVAESGGRGDDVSFVLVRDSSLNGSVACDEMAAEGVCPRMGAGVSG